MRSERKKELAKENHDLQGWKALWKRLEREETLRRVGIKRIKALSKRESSDTDRNIWWDKIFIDAKKKADNETSRRKAEQSKHAFVSRFFQPNSNVQ